MGIHVCQSHNPDILLQAMLKQVNQPTENLFGVLKTQNFVVPNKSVEKWITQKVAEQNGVSANTVFHNKLHAFQWFLYQAVLDDKERVRQANIPRLIIKLRVFEALKPFILAETNNLSPNHPLSPIIDRIYENSSDLSIESERYQKRQNMLYWIGDQVSRLFRNYITYRGHCDKPHPKGQCNCSSNWLNLWGQNKPLNIEALYNTPEEGLKSFEIDQAKKLEAWQRWLWLEIFHKDFEEMVSIDEMFWDALQNPDTKQAALNRIPEQVVVFTVLELPPSQLNFLRRLGEHIDIVLYHFNPSQEYWSDSVDSRWKKQYDLKVKERFIDKNLAQGKNVSDAEISKFFDDFNLNFNAEARESRHPLLTRLGKQARDHFSLLANLSSGEEGEWFDLFFDDFSDTLLGKVQSDILYLLEPEQHSFDLKADDESIKINVCHSTLRQVECLKEQLINWLAQGSPENPRNLDDVLVMSPNIKLLEPIIRGVFSPFAKNDTDNPYLPIKITGIPQSNAVNAWTSVLSRMKLLHGRFQFEEFADWLTLIATQTLYQVDADQVNRMLDLLKDAGFKRGFDEVHIKETVGDADCRFTFKYALDRLSMGVAVNQHIIINDILPLTGVSVDDFELIGKLLKIHSDLSDRRLLLSVEEPNRLYEEWLQVLLDEVAEYQLRGEQNLQLAQEVLQSHVRRITLASFSDSQQKKKVGSLEAIKLPLNYVLREIQTDLDSQLDATEPTGQITFSQIGYIRPLPYKLIVVLNMDSGVFPSQQQQIPFDLMKLLRQQLGDRSRTEDEQGAFLDALLLAKDNLWIFYNGFDLESGQPRQPSNILQELIDQLSYLVKPRHATDELGQMINVGGVELPEHLHSIYNIHPMQPYDANGFDGSTVRFKNQWFNVADKIQNATFKKSPWINTVYNPIQEVTTQITPGSKWINEMIFPADLYLSTLNIRNVKLNEVVPEFEPLVLSGLDRYSVREFMHNNSEITPELLSDKMPVGKLANSAWQQSQSSYNECLERLHAFAPEPTKVKTESIKLSESLTLHINVPEDANTQQWVCLKASSAYGEHRAKAWLEYLLWLAYLDLGQGGSSHKLITVFSNATIVSEGLTSDQAKIALSDWLDAWNYGQKQPLVLPAKLLMSAIEKDKQLEWVEDDETGLVILKDLDTLLKAWNETFEFSPEFPLSENRANKKHRDWNFILQNQNSNELLSDAINLYSLKLYAPIYKHQIRL